VTYLAVEIARYDDGRLAVSWLVIMLFLIAVLEHGRGRDR
jgi:hypothetical protein